MSTAVTDALLALAALGAAAALWRAGGRGTAIAALGLFLVGIAASAGTLRFAAWPELAPLHDGLTLAAIIVGMPLVGYGYVVALRGRELPLVVVASVIVGAAVALGGFAAYQTAAAAVAMVAVIASCVAWLRRRHQPVAARLGVAGAVLVLVAGVAVGTEGEIAGLPRIDLFHVLLAAAYAALGLALVVLAPPGQRSRSQRG